ncbi:pyrroloquinoline quinone-dependent dehydrogenase [Mucilaginibacter sp. cycad4]|uniref:pyrroloquinoline quinone-dependent dehydrogenase n=1 Tax=Mucilaginibacter sp. cycad4 TaxID=3342096 RepID=UPI002AAB84A8|nr:pyrroloquinoline quinone-dependent dehydrogenase [Mucilaginibacter gossypii]WPV01934.1 pyrroloquinoline quinone-dependent dehydrogenase [Mucilaginibacter gossypii]
MKAYYFIGTGFVILCILMIHVSFKPDNEKSYQGWKVYGGNNEHNHYSSLTDIDTNNVSKLQVAWQYHTQDAGNLTQIQVNPIIIDGILYGVSPKLKLFAVDAATGKERWSFDPVPVKSEGPVGAFFNMNVCRGVTYYKGGENDQRIFYSASSNLYCINASTGKPVTSFGESGKIDLHDNLGRDVKNLYVASTSPGTIYKNLIIVGTRVSEDAAAAPGHIRAYDVHTGALRWIFHTIPQPGEYGYNTWDDKEAYKHIGGANSWAGFSLDEQKGILFAPIGSASFDHYGGRRTGNSLYANCLVALNAATGKRIWHFQTVHHDVWDRDLPTAPVLLTITKGGKKIDAVAQVTKTGFVFILDRNTGLPIYPVEEKPVPAVSGLLGEKLSPTQPVPTLPKPFVRQVFLEKDLNNIVPASSYEMIKEKLAGYNTGNMFNPPSLQGTISFPGTDGGAEWGGPAYDPTTGLLYVNASEVPWAVAMRETGNPIVSVRTKQPAAIKQPRKTAPSNETIRMAGKRLYIANCMGCHGADRSGAGNIPSLIAINKKYKQTEFLQLIAAGRRMMPGFGHLPESQRKAIAAFVLDIKTDQNKKFVPSGQAEDEWFKMPYLTRLNNKFLTKEGYPAVAPPWGTLSAINVNTGELVWKETLGDYPELKAKGIHSGTENYGGPTVTAGGLLFIAATSDSKMRAFNKKTGKLLWEFDLPACGFATPSVYELQGKQFLVIACGGGKLGKPSGDSYMAFALPDNK